MAEGLRYDAGKPPVDLLSAPALIELARVLEFGATKYERHNWRKGMAWSKVIGPMFRHVLALLNGEDRDPESGLLHAAHVMTNAMFLTEYQLKGLGTDDRYRGEPSPTGLPKMPSLEYGPPGKEPGSVQVDLRDRQPEFISAGRRTTGPFGTRLQPLPGGKGVAPRHASDRVVPETDLDFELSRLKEIDERVGCANPDCHYCSARRARIAELAALKAKLP